MGMSTRGASRFAASWSVAAAAWLAAIASGCGQTAVSMVVVRPALINAQPFGGSVSVAGFVARQAMAMPVAGQLRLDVERAILAGHGGTVPLLQAGGSLAIAGTVDHYGVALTTEERDGRCKVAVKVQQGGAETEQPADRPCKHRRNHWVASIVATVRITSSAGQIVYLRQLQRSRDGWTPWGDESAPAIPDQHANLQTLRRELADEIAWVVVPHRERVTEYLYDCDPPATRACQDGARLLAASRYDDALAAYAAALQAFATKPATPAAELAEVHWNRAIVAKYARRFDLAVQALREAIRLDDSHRYRVELGNVERAASDHERLIDQGLGGGAPAQP